MNDLASSHSPITSVSQSRFLLYVLIFSTAQAQKNGISITDTQTLQRRSHHPATPRRAAPRRVTSRTHKHTHHPVAFHIKRRPFFFSTAAVNLTKCVTFAHMQTPNTHPRRCEEVKKCVRVCEMGRLDVKRFAGQAHLWVGERGRTKKKKRKIKVKMETLGE